MDLENCNPVIMASLPEKLVTVMKKDKIRMPESIPEHILPTIPLRTFSFPHVIFGEEKCVISFYFKIPES